MKWIVMRSGLRLIGLFRQPPKGLVVSRPFSVLALESSADDTCAAVVTSDKRLLANVVIRQHTSSVSDILP